ALPFSSSSTKKRVLLYSRSIWRLPWTPDWHSPGEQRYRVDMGMTLNIPDSVLQGLRIPEGEIAERLRTELAIALYAQGALSLGKAAELAQMERMPFGELVGLRGIARHYGDAELAQDISYARSE